MRSAPIQNNRVISVNNEGGMSGSCNANTWTGMKNDVGLKWTYQTRGTKEVLQKN